MNTGGLDVMNLLEQKMMYDNQKQKVHAENTANASTPGYRSLEIAPFTFNDALKQASVGMKVTDPRHIVPASMAGANAATVKVKGNDSSPDGNSVDTEQEAMKSSQTNIDFNLVTTIYKKLNGFLRIALKGS